MWDQENIDSITIPDIINISNKMDPLHSIELAMRYTYEYSILIELTFSTMSWDQVFHTKNIIIDCWQ